MIAKYAVGNELLSGIRYAIILELLPKGIRNIARKVVIQGWTEDR